MINYFLLFYLFCFILEVANCINFLISYKLQNAESNEFDYERVNVRRQKWICFRNFFFEIREFKTLKGNNKSIHWRRNIRLWNICFGLEIRQYLMGKIEARRICENSAIWKDLRGIREKKGRNKEEPRWKKEDKRDEDSREGEKNFEVGILTQKDLQASKIVLLGSSHTCCSLSNPDIP